MKREDYISWDEYFMGVTKSFPWGITAFRSAALMMNFPGSGRGIR